MNIMNIKTVVNQYRLAKPQDMCLPDGIDLYDHNEKYGVHETTEYLELFLKNLLLNENYPLHNRTLHISGFSRD